MIFNFTIKSAVGKIRTMSTLLLHCYYMNNEEYFFKLKNDLQLLKETTFRKSGNKRKKTR